MVDLHVHTQTDLPMREQPFDENKYYQKAVVFADEVLCNTLKGYVNTIKARKEEQFEKNRKAIEDAQRRVQNARNRTLITQRLISAGLTNTIGLRSDLVMR